jgi:hypothetical protein
MDNAIHVRGTAYGIPLSVTMSAGIDQQRHEVWTDVSRVSIAHIPVPAFLYGAMTQRRFSLEPGWGSETPFSVVIQRVAITQGSIIIQ